MAKDPYRIDLYSTEDGPRWRIRLFCDTWPKAKQCAAAKAYKGRCNGAHSPNARTASNRLEVLDHTGNPIPLSGLESQEEAEGTAALVMSAIAYTKGAALHTPTNATLNQIADDFFSRPRPSTMNESTFKWYRSMWNSGMRDSIGTHPIADIGTKDVKDWLDDMASEPNAVPQTTLDGYRKVLARVGYKHAENLDLWDRKPPTETVEMPASDGTSNQGERRQFTFPEIVKLYLAFDEDQAFRSMFLFGLLTGARPGELAGLSYEHFVKIDDDHWLMKIRRQWNGSKFGPPKWNSERNLPIPPQFIPALLAHFDWLSGRFPEGTEHGAIFPSPEGRLLNRRNFARRHWRWALETARESGLSIPDCVPYSMRHTFNLLAREHLPLEHVKALMGHSSRELAVNTYAKVNPDVKLWAFGDENFWNAGIKLGEVWVKGLHIGAGGAWSDGLAPKSALVNSVPLSISPPHPILEGSDIVNGSSNGNSGIVNG